MLVVLVAAGAFVYWRVQFALDRDLDQELNDTFAQLAPQVENATIEEDEELLSGETYQVLRTDGTVLAHGPDIGNRSLLDTAALAAVRDAPVTLDVGELPPASPDPLRVYAVSLPQSADGTVLAVAARSDSRDEALRELLAQLILAGLATLVVTAVVGNRLAKASLQPVERYRRQAADISAGATGVRLDVPAQRDDEITRLGNTLNQMLETLEETLARERRFVDDASHELRTPLTLLRTRVDLALRRPRTTVDHERILSEISTDVNRLSHLAEQLLTLGVTRSFAVTHSDGSGTADLAAVVRSAAERRRTLAAPGSPYEPSGDLNTAAAGPAIVAVDQEQLGRVVDNLLDNAVLHGRAPVTAEVGRVEGDVRLQIVDAGDGMDASTLALAPERFARGAEARSRPGSGLGLSLVLAIIEGAGGELRLCVNGRHERFGMQRRAPCTHGEAMTVTVLLAGADGPIATPGHGQPVDPSTGTG